MWCKDNDFCTDTPNHLHAKILPKFYPQNMLLIVSMLVEILPKFYATITNEFLTVSHSIHGYYHSHRTAFPSQLC